jgi:hypothetical protein
MSAGQRTVKFNFALPAKSDGVVTLNYSQGVEDTDGVIDYQAEEIKVDYDSFMAQLTKDQQDTVLLVLPGVSLAFIKGAVGKLNKAELAP